VRGLTRKRILKLLDRDYAKSPGAWTSLSKMLKILIKHAIDIEMLDHDPSIGIKRPKLKEIRPWTTSEIAKFENRWSIDTKQRLAFSLMLYTGQRRSDVHRMSWTDIEQGGIRVIQQKTEAELIIPIHCELRKVLEASKREVGTIVVTEYGRPFTVDGFSQWMRQAIKKAGLPLACQPHGLRKAAARHLAEAGCSTHEIKAITGHTTLAEVDRYTRGANQKALAERAIAKSEDHNTNKLPQTKR
jgi:enterobacteria phage integrase